MTSSMNVIAMSKEFGTVRSIQLMSKFICFIQILLISSMLQARQVNRIIRLSKAHSLKGLLLLYVFVKMRGACW